MLSSQEKEYFQQVNYQIDVSLNDEDHTLSAYEKIKYKNNSPDELKFIWFIFGQMRIKMILPPMLNKQAQDRVLPNQILWSEASLIV